MATKQPAYQSYELVHLSERRNETTTMGLFSLPLELRLNIYNLVLDDEYEIYETGLPALLRTRLQITREFYQFCKLRIVLVYERKLGFFTHRFWRRLPKSLRIYRRGDKKRHRLWRHWERILKFGKTIPRRDLFVDVKMEQWCTHAAVYPEKAIRSHGQCRDCKVQVEKMSCLLMMFCIVMVAGMVLSLPLWLFLRLVLYIMDSV